MSENHLVDMHTTGRPTNAILDLLSRRHMLRILWELRRSGPLTFRALQAAAGDLSPTVLNKRLGELRETLIVTHIDGDGYTLTPLGEQLMSLFSPMKFWLSEWVDALEVGVSDSN